jgi:hypothetical protein
MFDIDPFSIAVQGITSTNVPINIALMGWVVTVTEEEIEVPEQEISKTGIGQNTRYEKKKRKKIIVNVEKDGKSYFKEKIYKNVNITAKDIKVEITETKTKPIIHITLLK